MNIHQMQVRYQSTPDRVLWQLRTTEGELFAVWLTRRMLRLLWPHLNRHVTLAGVARLAPNATPASVLPEAQAMLAQAARERPLPGARFDEPFDNQVVVARPLGPEPLLPEAVDLGPGADGRGLKLQVRELGGRRMAMTLNDDLATALMRLLEAALKEADWGPASEPAAPSQPAGPIVPQVLN
ncbi:MAG: hypothetical protein JNL87_16470 [Burkholderiaceae bacterium]|nr:hypothetical protein [Burkholderiaceae bacterium]